jgi:hypothetical protein
MSFSPEADASWRAARKVAARLDVVRESRDQLNSRSYRIRPLPINGNSSFIYFPR